LIARDWNREVGVNYAPPSFIGAEAPAAGAAATAPTTEGATPATNYKSNVVDPIGDVIERLRGGAETSRKAEKAESQAAAAPPAASEEKSVDPLADVMADIRAGKGVTAE